MRATASIPTVRTGKPHLLASCAIAAGLAAIALGGPALAQVAGTGQVVGANPTVITTPINPTNTTQVNTNGASQTIINWTPTDNAPAGGTIDFLPTGNNLQFFGTGNYTVLNRFVGLDALGNPIPLSRQIGLNGTVNGYVGTPAGLAAAGTLPQGGNIWFYNAGGILIGARAAINVGSLVLTANDIDTTGGLFGPGGEIRFRGASGSTASIDISPQSFISASYPGNPGSSYVALVAPRINQGGIIDVDGSAALVAAEQADIRINNGLFDINVTVGAEGGNAITHTGITGGPAHQQGDTDQSRVYMVAIPKNDAVTMLISGQVGYRDAVVAQTDPDGAVVLSAGYNVANGVIAGAPVGTAAANITVNDTIFQSSVTAHASGAFVGQPIASIPAGGPVVAVPPPHLGRLIVQGNATFIGDASATVSVGNNQIVGATGNFVVSSNGSGGQAGNAAINVNPGGGLAVLGNLSLLGAGRPDAVTGNSTGGSAQFTVDGGTVVVGNGIAISAAGTGDLSATGIGGTGTGGTAGLTVQNGGSLTADTIAVSASGRGGGVTLSSLGAPIIADQGGNGQGGTAEVTVDSGGTLTANTSLSVTANGAGQIGNVQSGNGTGGTARIQVLGALSSLASPTTTLAAGGTGGGSVSSPNIGTFPSLNGGDGQGGTIELTFTADNSSTAALGDLTVNASAAGGNATGDGATGGNATGGTVTITADNGINAEQNSLSVDASALSGGASSVNGTSSTTGDAVGGTINVTINGGATLASDSSIGFDASAQAASGENRGNARGGTIAVTAIGSGGNSSLTALTTITANASVGGANGTLPNSTGTATGGDIDFTADGGTITAGSFDIAATAASGNSAGAGGAAQGGTIDIRAANTGVFSATDSAGTSSFATDAATGFSQGGASATGGRIGVVVDGGTVSFGAPAFFSSTGIAGGDASSAGNIVVGRGGSILLQVLDNNLNTSILNFQSLSVSADGRAAQIFEGPAQMPGTAAGNGGDITVDVQGGQVTGGQLQLSASGFSGSVAGDNGVGSGGIAAYRQTGGAANVGDLVVSANGVGGGNLRASAGGSGFGGTATIDLLGGTLDATTISAEAVGAGGVGQIGSDSDPANPVDGQNGGFGQGGTATINLNGNAVVTTTTLSALASGIGGDGGDFISAAGVVGNAGNGGNGQGGTAAINLTAGTLTSGDITADAGGFGGNGGGLLNLNSGPVSSVARGGNGGNGQGGTATIDLATLVTATGTMGGYALGVGGIGGTNNIGGDGGFGQGGTAELIVDNIAAGRVDVILDSSAEGGDGGDGIDGAGGFGGSAFGGISRVRVTGANGSATISQDNFTAGALGGQGGNAALAAGNNPRVGPAGGGGGNGTGGTVEVIADDGAVTLTFGRLSAVALGSFGTGGDGGTGADNPGTITLPGPDGIPGTPDDVVMGLSGGDGGLGGAGSGGLVHLVANGSGSISSSGAPVSIAVGGTSGAGGAGGVGSGGDGAGNAFTGTIGGRVQIETFGNGTAAGTITLGDTTIDANGDVAGRIELRSAGTIQMASLTANAFGGTSLTNNDTDVAPHGIFLGVTNGLIQTDGAVALNTDGSVGVYAQGTGQLNAGGALTVNAGDQVDIRHDFRTGTAPTIQSGTSASFTAVNSIRSAPGSLVSAGTSLFMNATGTNSAIDVDSLDAQTLTLLLATEGRINVYGTTTSGDDLTANARDEVAINAATAGDDISLTGNTIVAGRLVTTGTGLDSEVDGSNIFFSTVSAASVDHAEADNDFTADVGSFATGPNSIITGGDIDINAVGAVDLGNSTAGGFVAVDGQSIVFDTIGAGTTVTLNATGTAPGAEGILGNGITAGDNVALFGNTIRINDSVVTSASLFASSSGGNARLSATTDGDIVINSAGDIAGNYAAGGNVSLTAATNITAQANAAGTYVGPNGPSEGYLFVNAAGDANLLAGSSAATMIGVAAGTNANVDGATAGEDLYVVAGNTATVTNSLAGDDLIVTGTCCVIVDNVSTTGAGPDGRSLILAPSSAGGPDMWQIQTGPTDLSNIVLTASAGTIDASNAVAFDNLTATASNVVRTTNTIRSGLVTTITGSALDLESVTAGTDIILTSTSGGIGAIGALSAGHDLTITSAAGGSFADLSAGDDIRITANGNVSAATLLTTAGGADNEADNSGAYITTPGSIAITGATNTVGQTRLTAGGTVDAGAINADYTFIDAVGAVNITGDVTSGGMFIEGSSVALRNANGLSNQILLRATGGDVTANGNVTTLADLQVQATGAITISGAASGGNFVEMIGGSIDVADVSSNSFVTLRSNSGAINSTGTISAGSDVFINAATGGTFNAITAGDDVSIGAGGDVTIASITAEGSNPQGEEIGSNVSGTIAGVLTVTGSTFANDDVNFSATSMSLQDVTAGGSFTATTTGGPLTLVSADVANNITLTSARDVVATGLLQSGGDTTATGRNLNLRSIAADGDVDLTATVGTIATGGSVSGFNVTYDANGDITHDSDGLINAANILTLTAGGNIAVGNATSGDNMRFTAGGTIDANALTAGRLLALDADGAVTLTGDTFGALLVSITGSTVDLGDNDVGGGNIALFATNGDIGGTGAITANGGVTALATGAVDLTGDIVAASSADLRGASVNLGNVSANGFVSIAATNGAVTSTGLLSAGQDLFITTTQGATLNNLVAGDDIGITGSGSVTIASMRANGTNPQGEEIGSNATVDITGTLTVTGDTFAADDATFNALGIALQGVEVGGSLTATSTGSPITLASADAGANVILTSARTVTATGPIQSGQATTIRGTGLDLQSVTAGTDVGLTATTGNIVTGGDVSGVNVTFNAGGDIAHDNDSLLSAGNALTLTAGGDIDIGNASAGGNLLIDAGGAIAANALTSGNNLVLFADEAVDLTGDLDATNQLRIEGASIELNDVGVNAGALALTATTGGMHGTGQVDVGGALVASANTLVDLTGDITAGGLIDITGGSITVGNVTGGGDVGLTAITGAVNSAGTVQAARDIEIVTADGGSFNRLVAGDDIRLFGRGDVDIAFMDATGTNPESGESGSNVGIDLVGNVSVGHGEAAGDFIVNTTSFTTGLNSLIADGDIDITTTGASNLGNSTAGGSISVDAESIAFATLDAGDFVSLTASGTAPGAEGIAGSTILAGSNVFLTGNSITVGNIDSGGLLSAFGSGGDVAIANGTAVGNIGVLAGGNISGAYAAGGDIELSAGGNINVTANAAGGAPDPSNGDVDTAGNVFVDAGGNVTLTNSSGAGMVGVNADGSATLTNVTAGEDMLVLAGTTANLSGITVGDDLDVRAGGAVIATGVRATAAGPDGFVLDYTANGFTIGQGEGVSSLDGADIDLRSTGGSVTAAGLSAGDDIILGAATSLSVSGATTLGLGQTGGDSSIRTQSGSGTFAGLAAFDDVRINSSGNVAVTAPATAGRDITIAAASVDIASLTTPVGDGIDSLSAGRNLQVTTSGAISGGAVRAGGNLELAAGTTIAITRAVTGTGGSLALSGGEGVAAGTVASGGTTSLDSADGAIEIASLSSVGPVDASGNSIVIGSGSGNLVFSTLTTDVGDASITNSGNLSVTAGTVAGRASLRSTNGDLSVTQLGAADVQLESDDDMTLGAVAATNSLLGEAGGVLTVNGAVTGREMSFGSADIVIGSGGRLGTAGTTAVLDVRNTDGNSQTFIGGTGARDGYHIDAAEMARLYGTDIRIFAPQVDDNNGGFVAAAPGGLPIGSVGSSAQPDVIIDDFTMTAGSPTSNLGTNGTLTIETPGKARVLGDVLLTGMGDNNGLAIRASDALEVILGEGTIRLTGGSSTSGASTPGGLLTLESEDVIVATASAIADVAAAADIDAIDDRLAQNDGVTSDEGALFAGGIDVSVVGGFYVQNSGLGTRFAQRRGLTFGALGLNVNVEGSDSRIVINGVHLGPSGQVTGLDAIPLLSIDGFVIGSGPLSGSGLAFDSGSTMNGCLIVSSTTCAFLEFESSFPVQDVINKEDDDEGDSDDAEGMSLPVPLITMRSLDPLTGEPLLDDPVTGAGNDDLWTPPSE
ncbi:hypothetical protein ASD67_03080 [Sphingopyxis sp. Root1497]|uniref:hypothetical protein n=1 Tax=Sphingopyxis sp. Root1497 TaxID=1736474 RepID=UPI0006F2A141|nr:hypothetical protein [Sphingopyxis sp. Root1497]KQZ65400.1 hypothetical protein ASD67_03080 [Sphingopyxis sp. Root1497]